MNFLFRPLFWFGLPGQLLILNAVTGRRVRKSRRKSALSRERKNQPKVILRNFFSRTPAGPGRPRLQVKDVRAKQNYISLRSPSDVVKVFGPGRAPGYLPGCLRDVRPKNFTFRLLSVPDFIIAFSLVHILALDVGSGVPKRSPMSLFLDPWSM